MDIIAQWVKIAKMSHFVSKCPKGSQMTLKGPKVPKNSEDTKNTEK